MKIYARSWAETIYGEFEESYPRVTLVNRALAELASTPYKEYLEADVRAAVIDCLRLGPEFRWVWRFYKYLVKNKDVFADETAGTARLVIVLRGRIHRWGDADQPNLIYE